MIIMGTAIANAGALRAFAKAGFRPVRQFDDLEYGRFWLLRYAAGAYKEQAVDSPAASV